MVEVVKAELCSWLSSLLGKKQKNQLLVDKLTILCLFFLVLRELLSVSYSPCPFPKMLKRDKAYKLLN